MSDEVLIFIDPGYLNGIGHYENYARRLREAARQRDVELIHYVNRDVLPETASQHGLIPFFPYKGFIDPAVFQDIDAREHVINTFASRLRVILRSAVEKARVGRKVRLFMYTGHPILLPAIGKLMNAQELTGLNIGFHFNLFYVDNEFALKLNCPNASPFITKINSALEDADPGHRVKLFADSNRIINIYTRYFSRSFTLLPIPLACDPKVSESGKSGAGDDVSLGFLGYTQPKQGYPWIRRLYHDLLDNPDYQQVRLKVRHNVFNIDGAMIADLRDLVASHERIENTINYQTPEDYEAFIQKCDLLLIPHSRLHYPVQTSGMFIDALCRAKSVVVPENTWLSDQLAEYGAGITFSGTTYESFRDAVFQALQKLPELQKQRMRNLESFASFHSPENLLRVLFDTSAPIEQEIVERVAVNGDGIELLSLDLLNRDMAITDLVYSEKYARHKNLGWHYMLDLVWIVTQLKDLPAGSVVLDAGAGDGLLQYILLRMGLRVISVDFIARRGPEDVDWLAMSRDVAFDNEYVQHLKNTYSLSVDAIDTELQLNSPEEFLQQLRDRNSNLIFYRADVSGMTLVPSDMVDAVVSVSALEHNDHEATAAALAECRRVLKPGGEMVVTVSATDKEDWFHEPSKGWCYSEETLRRLFQLETDAASNFSEYCQIMDELCAPGNELHVQLAPFYFTSGNNGMPWGRWRPEYAPVGIKKRKPVQ